MGDEEYGKELSSSCEGGGYSIFLDEKEMYAFMEDGDFSSARDLDHFRNVEAGIEKRLVEGKGFTILAMSIVDSRISRDFSVLQIAHLLSKNGKKVNIVDCDFFDPGMNGLVQNIEDHGFLDLLLYGSSLKSVMKPTGIDGVQVTGSGSFPVSRTIPFALKEFSKVNDYLSSNSDVVIYCSTLYTDDDSVNPLSQFVDSILFCCSIEKMEEGELQKILKDIGPDLPPSDLVCFCSAKEAKKAIAGEKVKEDDDIMDLEPESEILDHDSEEDDIRPEFIEKTEEIDSVGRKEKRWVSFPVLVALIVSVMIIVFIIWWVSIDKSVQEKEGADRMSELILKQQDARDLAQKDNLRREEEQTGGSSGAGEELTGSSGEDAAESTAGEDGPQAVEYRDENVQGDSGDESKDSMEQRTLAPEGTCYSVHIASFLDTKRAGTESDFFEKKDYDVRVVEVVVNGKTWYRVYIGEYETKEEAEAMKTELLSFRRIREARVLNVKYN